MDGCDVEYLVKFIVHSYKMWVNYNEFMVFYNEKLNKTMIVKCRKRGNDVYQTWFRGRYHQFMNAFEKEEHYFSFFKKERMVKSPLVFATLTFKHDNFMKIGEEVGLKFNRFMARLRKRFKHIYVLARSWQCHRDGWIHIHAILLLDTWLYGPKQWFSGFRHVSKKDGKVSYRLSKHMVEWFKAQWVYGFSDFQLCDSLRGSLRYLSRYIFQKQSESEVEDVDIQTLTYAICWIFKLRSFSFNYRKAYTLFSSFKTLLTHHRLDRVKRNSNSNLEDMHGKCYECYWVLVGFIDERSPIIPLNGFFEVIDGYPSFLI